MDGGTAVHLPLINVHLKLFLRLSTAVDHNTRKLRYTKYKQAYI